MIKLIKKVLKLILGEDSCFYITNGTALLPEKLNTDEERDVLQKIKMGDKEAKSELIERNLRLVVYIAQRFASTGLSIDDLTGIGTIGLIKASSSFDGDKNIKFATFASRCIENEILMYLRKTNKVKSEVSLDDPLSTDKDGNELVLADIIGSDGDTLYKTVEQKMECSNLNTLIENLNKRERIIMKLRYGLNKEAITSGSSTTKSVCSRLRSTVWLVLP